MNASVARVLRPSTSVSFRCVMSVCLSVYPPCPHRPTRPWFKFRDIGWRKLLVRATKKKITRVSLPTPAPTRPTHAPYPPIYHLPTRLPAYPQYPPQFQAALDELYEFSARALPTLSTHPAYPAGYPIYPSGYPTPGCVLTPMRVYAGRVHGLLRSLSGTGGRCC